MLLLQSAQAETYTPESAEACRASPAPDVPVLRRLQAGEAVIVAASQGDWRKVRAGDSTYWIESEAALVTGHGAAGARPTVRVAHPRTPHSHPLTTHRRAVVRHAVRHAGHHGRAHRISGSGCSCGGHNVCYGPHGGRYCSTSGGNKRYGI